ncbi:hypothetical protein K504DRAFT_457398 [Pleomassaria siparia CBS 279.74]|uniref:Uncharacterized protein n=1 Tax=Pleomassaria siparia CBS 279.74 TaxID=1314801 RepID=A0A6G1KRP7_9PLEO|nr:hypothetical protein K504DRAFT_457398 [Pleomassaria siparia CBS 279.74]
MAGDKRTAQHGKRRRRNSPLKTQTQTKATNPLTPSARMTLCDIPPRPRRSITPNTNPSISVNTPENTAHGNTHQRQRASTPDNPQPLLRQTPAQTSYERQTYPNRPTPATRRRTWPSLRAGHLAWMSYSCRLDVVKIGQLHT